MSVVPVQPLLSLYTTDSDDCAEEEARVPDEAIKDLKRICRRLTWGSGEENADALLLPLLTTTKSAKAMEKIDAKSRGKGRLMLPW